jgi:hypothetical protein
MANISEIMNWGCDPDQFLEWRHEIFYHKTSIIVALRFRRYSKTMYSDELAFIRSFWLLCELQQIEWSNFDRCKKFICMTTDAVVESDCLGVCADEIELLAYRSIRETPIIEAVAQHAGFENALITISDHLRGTPLGELLASQVRLLNSQ